MVHHSLAIDAGNTRFKFGLFVSSDSGPGLPDCRRFTSAGIGARLPWDEIRGWLAEVAPDSMGIALAGSNPRAIDRLRSEWPQDLNQPRIVDQERDLKLDIRVEQPSSVGIDRLLNAIAANVVRRPGRAAVVIDSGTATTIDLVTPDGTFAGGAILPGIELSAKALHQYTALLPLVHVGEAGVSAPAAVGRNTRDAIRSGLLWGQVGAIRSLMERIRSENCASAPESSVLLTGGASQFLTAHIPNAARMPRLALQGLVIASREQSDLDQP